jgi:hypothetical protein
MRYLKSYKIFESVDEIKSTIEDILRDNILDKYIPLKIHVRNYTSDNTPCQVIKIQIGDEIEDYGYVINVEDIKQDILTITEYLKEEGYEYNTFSYIDDYQDVQGDSGDVMRSNDLKTHYLSLFYKKKIRDIGEKIEIPIEIGDTVLGGRFKNKKTLVKKIGKNKKGDITINDKPLLKYRILKEDIDIDYYLGHLEGDDFRIEIEKCVYSFRQPFDKYNRLRIYKPINESVYKYSNCKGFKWLDLEDDLLRFIDEVGIDNILNAYIIHEFVSPNNDHKGWDKCDRTNLDLEDIFNKSPFDGDILSITLFYK